MNAKTREIIQTWTATGEISKEDAILVEADLDEVFEHKLLDSSDEPEAGTEESQGHELWRRYTNLLERMRRHAQLLNALEEKTGTRHVERAAGYAQAFRGEASSLQNDWYYHGGYDHWKYGVPDGFSLGAGVGTGLSFSYSLSFRLPRI